MNTDVIDQKLIQYLNNFNLAMAYEQTGQVELARPCWRKYLEIEPTGTWAEIARKHL